MSEEMNSAEAEAEQILKDALASFDSDVEDCPQGDECAIHHRVDEVMTDDVIEFGRLITYVGDYCVITTDNPEMENPVTLAKLMLGQITTAQLPDIYETSVLYVGPEGTLSDLKPLDHSAKLDRIRFEQTHDSWKNFRPAHESVVSSVSEGLLDLSTSTRKAK